MNVKDSVDDFFKKNPWIESRLWDDDCICESEDKVNPNCTNKRCRELK